MILRPVRFLWKQMNGPQVTAIMTALFRYMRDTFNPIIEYLTTFSIATATDTHLTFIGTCMGIIRPIIQVADLSNFIFTTDPEHGKDYGVSEAPGPNQVGGRFTDLYEDMRNWTTEYCPELYYRQVLQGCAEINAHPMSVVYLDELLYHILTGLFPVGPIPEYSFTWIENTYPDSGTMKEDLRLDLGAIDDWPSPDIAAEWQGVLSGIINNVWKPEQKCTVTFSQ